MPNSERARIVIDCSPLRYLHTGLGQFSFHLLRELALLPFPEAVLHALVHPDYAHLVPTGISVEPASWIRRHAPRQIQPLLLGPSKVWHMTTENTRITGVPRQASIVLTIHGLHFLDEETKPVAERQLKNVQALVDQATVLTVVSGFTANLVREKLDTNSKDIRVIPNGISRIETAPSAPPWAPSGKFLISVGTFFPRKNLHVLIPMMKLLPEYSLVLAGDTNHPYGKLVADHVREAGMTDRIILPGEITESEKVWLYQKGEALVFPSLSEGFGIPLIECFQHGKPVFCSRLGSLKEVGKDHAFYWDDFDPGVMASMVRNKLRNESAAAVTDRINYAKQFSWVSAARSYHEIYRSLI